MKYQHKKHYCPICGIFEDFEALFEDKIVKV